MIRKTLLALLAIAALAAMPAWAGIAVGVDTPFPGSIQGNQQTGSYTLPASDPNFGDTSYDIAGSVAAVAFTLNVGGYFPVAVHYQGGLFDTVPMSAFLTNAIGPSATQAGNEFYATTFNPSNEEAGWVTLWQNIWLAPSTYYLVIGTSDSNTAGYWSSTTQVSATEHFGAVRGDGLGTISSSTRANWPLICRHRISRSTVRWAARVN